MAEELAKSQAQIKVLKEQLETRPMVKSEAAVVPVQQGQNGAEAHELVFLRDDIKAMSAKLKEALGKIEEEGQKEGEYKNQIADLKKKLEDVQAKLTEASAGDNAAGLRAALADAREQIRATSEELRQQKQLFDQFKKQAGKDKLKMEPVPAE